MTTKKHNLFVQNSKMKKSGDKIFNFGIPAYKNKDGEATCPFAGSCAKGCYAQMSSYTWVPVKNAYERRYEATKQDDFADLAISEIKKRKITKVRIHDSGDFYSLRYLDKWIKIITQCPETQFYAYTKSIPFFKLRAKHLPENFRIIYSYGGKKDHLINTKKHNHTQVFGTSEELQAAGYIDASNDDNRVFEGHKIGLVYHGYNKGKEAWGL